MIDEELSGIANDIATETKVGGNTSFKIGDLFSRLIGKIFSKDDVSQSTGTSADKVMSQSATTSFVNATKKSIINDADIYNVTNKTPLSAGLYYTATTAREAVPTAIRKPLLNLRYLISATEWVEEQFVGTDVSNWSIGTNWKTIPSHDQLAQVESGLSLINITWRDERRIYFDTDDLSLKIKGEKTVPSTDSVLLRFGYQGITYTIHDDINTSVKSVVSGNSGLFIAKSETDITYTLDDIVVFNDALEHDDYVKIASITYAKEVSSFIIYNKANYNNINDSTISNQSEFVQYYGSARLFWSYDSGKLYISGDVPSSAGNLILRLKYKDKTIRLTNSVLAKSITDSGNYQLLFALPTENTIDYSLDDLIVQEGTTYNTSTHVKIGHLIFAKGISSLIIKDKPSVSLSDIEDINLSIYSVEDNHNYSDNLRLDSSILSTGVIETLVGRAVFFLKLETTGVAASIKGCTVMVYQWYSSFPDYVLGTNSLGRTTTNTPPANAKYCGITIDMAYDYSNISVYTTSKVKDINVIYSSYINNSIGENCFANGVRNSLKILGFGNSFMRNSVYYLSSIAKGVDVNLIVGNLYIGGVNLSTHLSNMINNTDAYQFYKYVDGANTENSFNKTAEYGLKSERWDAVILHQYQPTPVMPGYEAFQPNLNLVIKKIIEILGYCPKFYINSTWAGSLDNNATYYNYPTELEMYEGVKDANIDASKTSGIMSILPLGTAIQNARTLSYADTYNRFVNAGTDWHHLNPAGGFIAACTIYEKIIYPLTGIHCSNTTFRILTSTSLPPQTSIEDGVIVTDDNYLDMCNAAIEAVKTPYSVTSLS